MDVRTGGKGSAWKLCLGLAIACGVLVFAAGFLHRSAVASAIDAQQTKAATYVRGKLADAVGDDELTKQLGDQASAALKKDADVPAGTDVQIFALDGTPVFSSGRAGTGDRAAIASAAGGEVSRVISGADLAVYVPIETKGKPVAVAAVVSDVEAVRANASGPLDALRLPLVALGAVLLVAGIALLARGRRSRAVSTPKVAAPSKVAAASKEQATAKPDSSAKDRISGFDPAPAGPVGPQPASNEAPAPRPTSEPAPQPAPAPVEAADAPTGEPARSRMSLRSRKVPKDSAVQAASSSPKIKKSRFVRSGSAAPTPPTAGESPSPPMTADREASIRRLLEDQLEQLRAKLQKQEEAAASASREWQDQLDAAIRRAQVAEAGADDSPDAPTSVGPAERDMIDRLRTLETELEQAKTAAAEAIARADELERVVDATPQADAAGPNVDAGSNVDTDANELVETRTRLAAAEQRAEEAQRLATEAEQRAASIESVRGELEVRVAQLGAKAGELEQKATELEMRLQEANAGGDAVRAEIATLTAALTAADARVEELESVVPTGLTAEEVDASAAEITRLRTELANQMERAQVAEDRVATLEADVLAAEHGVQTLTDESIADDPEDVGTAPWESEQVSAATVLRAPSTAEPERQPEPEPERQPQPEPEQVASPQTVWVAPAASVEPEPERQAEPELEPEPKLEPEPEPEEAAAAEPTGDGFSAVFAAAFGNEDANETVPASAEAARATATSLPQAPDADDRYGDVWSESVPEPEGAEDPAAHPRTTVASSLDDDQAAAAGEPAAGNASANEDDSMSVEDDLWALRARLAHAAEDHEGQESANEGPRWS